MKTIYLVDYLGIHCGMHYYLEAFQKILKEIDRVNVKILSNFSNKEGECPFFLNQFKGNSKIVKGVALLKNIYRLKKMVSTHKDAFFIYLTYGNSSDLIFMNIISKAPNHIIDIHEAIAQNLDTNVFLKNKFKDLYKKKIQTIISHSSRTNLFLDEYGYEGLRLNVPHFRYVFPKDYDISKVSSEVIDSIVKERINLLFFGNLNESKGVDILLEAYNDIQPLTVNNVNIIIAGKDFDGTINRVKIKSDRSVSMIKRHISDDELCFLYHNVDYLCLPYRKTSQSGILEMAFYFKKPIIASDVPYFRKTLSQFPSFGILAGVTKEEYAEGIEYIVKHHADTEYFLDEEYKKYVHRSEVENFKIDFQRWMTSREHIH